jgi:hypothetical protein
MRQKVMFQAYFNCSSANFSIAKRAILNMASALFAATKNCFIQVL